MKIVGIVGSPRIGGNTELMVQKVLEGSKTAGADTEMIHLGKLDIKYCSCREDMKCYEEGSENRCWIKDDMAAALEEIRSAEGIVMGTPAYMNLLSGQMKVFLDRLAPLGKEKELKGKKAILLAVGCKDEERIVPALENLKTYCKFREIDIVDSFWVTAAGRGDVSENKKALEKCHELGKLLAKSV